jgi:hypothetical protein
MVPALFDDAEKEGLVSAIRSDLGKRGLPDSKEACWAAFLDKCRANLHIVLAMSPVGDALRSRCRNFPGLVNNTVINWFEPWPEQVCVDMPCVCAQDTVPLEGCCCLSAPSADARAAAAFHHPRPCPALPLPSWRPRTWTLLCGQPSWSTWCWCTRVCGASARSLPRSCAGTTT